MILDDLKRPSSWMSLHVSPRVDARYNVLVGIFDTEGAAQGAEQLADLNRPELVLPIRLGVYFVVFQYHFICGRRC